ncbi:MAG: glycosyltransferase family 1 protein [candidate division Zixibacteria bacterium]|nr:glycosyltransferase family 1 protein [candidate division Zixibacteria bacterium]
MKIKPLLVLPSLPEKIARLQELANNVWYAWSPELTQLFRRLDEDTYDRVNQNPVMMLAHVPQERLREAAEDESFVAHLGRVYEAFTGYMARKKWFENRFPAFKNAHIAYFSCEFGLDVSLPMYSGGLGVLSGDHLKSASDLGIPIVAVGLLYRYGYFQQSLTVDGWQTESYTENDWYNMPVTLEKDASGKPIQITVEMGTSPVKAQIWRVQVGKVPLYLLDANIPENPSMHREITYQLYTGDKDIRIRQEILLGIGGVRALEALGYHPGVYHLNEGHSMFLCLERVRRLMERDKLSYEEAVETVWSTNVFTTHTPVPAGNEQFDAKLMEKYLTPMGEALGIGFRGLMKLGRVIETNDQEPFSMTVGALRLSAFANGVSQLHGKTSRSMWRFVWPGYPDDEVPITSITNGVHPYSWISPTLGELYETYIGPRYIEQPEDPSFWDKIYRIPNIELWRAHQRNKEQLIFFTRQRIRRQAEAKGKSQQELNRTEEILDPHALTVGFARRFATYKRGYMLFSDLERLRKLVSNADRPIQFIFAGKAHPRDNYGKEIIKSIVHIAQRNEFYNNVIFLENYDLDLAWKLVAGVDVWLNTPRRPEEASGTSGMKAALNGALNVSILDGWWVEGYTPDTGWAIGSPNATFANNEEQDYIESQELYDILERDVIPMYYDRNKEEYPPEWIQMMKNSIVMGGKRFSSHRMLREYTEKFYVPAIQSYENMTGHNYGLTKECAIWSKRLAAAWNKVTINSLEIEGTDGSARVGQATPVTLKVFLGELKPEDVKVEVVRGMLNAQDQIVDSEVFGATPGETSRDGHYTYHVDLTCTRSGRMGITARVTPYNARHLIKHHPRLVAWLA